MPRPIRPAPPVGGNPAALPQPQPELVGELAAVVEDLLNHYVDVDDGSYADGERALIDHATAVLARARRAGWRP